MRTNEEPIFYACWMRRGEWELRVDSRHQDSGHRHVHIRRRRNAKGEFSWNADGTRHDKHRFPVSEGIQRAKEIAADELKIPISSLEFLTGVPKDGRVLMDQGDNVWYSHMRVYSEADSVVLVSENWLVVIAPEVERNSESSTAVQSPEK